MQQPTATEPTLTSNSLEAANAQFKMTQKTQEGVQDRPQYEIDALTVREKTARLRSLRLAKVTTDT